MDTSPGPQGIAHLASHHQADPQHAGIQIEEDESEWEYEYSTTESEVSTVYLGGD
jgi:hypothetical protein